MKKLITSLFLVLMGLVSFAKPVDEGMWLPILLKDYNYEKMKALGLKLTPEQIYSANQASMKDAIVWFNGGCTGEIISQNGLVLTNHHCGYDAIATLSTTDDNILDNGFFAKSHNEERPSAGLWVSVLVRMEDVSDQILPSLAGLGEKERRNKVAELSKAIEAKYTEGTHYTASVRGFFNDNQYIVFVMERFTDIRLVGTPPQSIGKFGGDTDNWMWPRHTGDFSMFRIYAGKDNKPANYSADNIPYVPKHSLPVSLKGVKEGDFSMVFGFPGRTNRYATSFELQLSIDKINPGIVNLRDARLKIMLAEMKKSDSLRLLLSAEYASIANYWKFYMGETEQLQRLKIVPQKEELESRFQKWAEGKEEYASVLNNLRQATNNYREVALQRIYLNEGILASKLSLLAVEFSPLDSLLGKKGKEEDVKAIVSRLNDLVIPYVMESYNRVIDESIMAATLNMYYNDIPKEQHPAIIAQILKKYKADSPKVSFEKFAADAFKKSMFTDTAKIAAFFKNPSSKKLNADPIYMYANAFFQHYVNNYKTQVDAYNATKAIAMRTYINGLMAMDADLVKYPDANSTLRLTYGTVKSYQPKDGVLFSYYTTIEGIMEKYVPKDYEFNVPQRLLDLYKSKDYGQYAMSTGELPVAFISDNDITGGNSGSPVINANGELIGLAFDGNWEAMSGNIVFDPKYKRCINVDIRYVLFIIDKYHGAGNIINELNLVK